jgi:hypothetical protein
VTSPPAWRKLFHMCNPKGCDRPLREFVTSRIARAVCYVHTKLLLLPFAAELPSGQLSVIRLRSRADVWDLADEWLAFLLAESQVAAARSLSRVSQRTQLTTAYLRCIWQFHFADLIRKLLAV